MLLLAVATREPEPVLAAHVLVRLVNPIGVNQDQYDRLIRYVHDSGRDTGLGQIKRASPKRDTRP